MVSETFKVNWEMNAMLLLLTKGVRLKKRKRGDLNLRGDLFCTIFNPLMPGAGLLKYV